MLYGATFSLNSFPAENAGTLVAGIVIGSLVLGLRPSRSERYLLLSETLHERHTSLSETLRERERVARMTQNQ